MPHLENHGRSSRTDIPVNSTRPSTFEFPTTHHLVIATERQILGWDHDDVSPLFSSESNGILAATKTKDGSGLIAIADSQLVILRDVAKGTERSCKLNGQGERAQLLECSDDSQTLFFTTTLENAVQAYSLKTSKLLKAGTSHPSPPTVLAVSPQSRFQFTASENPPTAFLHNLTHQSRPIAVTSRFSCGPVMVAAFHPDRPNIFLLGFKDGTVTCYDANRILRNNKSPDKTGGMKTGNAELGHLKKLHGITRQPARSTTNSGDSTSTVDSKSVSIVAASFVPGHSTRAVTAGGDGKCRIIDFGAGGKIVRTWHCKAPVTSIDVLQLNASIPDGPARREPVKTKKPVSDPTSPSSYLIAVARVDGKVLIYDSMGLLLEEKDVESKGGRVLSVKWVPGPIQRPPRLDEKLSAQGKGHRRRSSSMPSTLDAGLEDFEGTVAYRSIRGPVHRDLPAVPRAGYMDLFSPVKRGMPSPDKRQSPVSRSHPRPRLRSSTFTDNTPESSPERSNRSSRLVLTPFGTSDLISNSTSKIENPQESLSTPSPDAKRYESEEKGNKNSAVHRPGVLVSSASSGNSAKILADLRRVQDNVGQKPSTLAYVASYLRSPPSGSLPSDRDTPSMSSEGCTKTSDELNPGHDKSSLGSQDSGELDVDGGDIWVTSTEDSTPLPPGMSTSPQGPVEVGSYFPRGSSLRQGKAKPHNRSIAKVVGVMPASSSFDRNDNHGQRAEDFEGGDVAEDGCCMCPGGCCHTLREEVGTLKAQMMNQAKELETLRSLVESLMR